MASMSSTISLESKAAVARPGTKSLRATIPEGIVAFLSIKEGDSLEWSMEIMKGERIAFVRRASAKRGKD